MASSLNADSAGIHLIKRAVELDSNKRYAEALVCYREGIELLMDTLKTITEEKKRLAFREKVCSYIDRAEKLKKLVDEIKESGKYHEQINIEENSIGYSYERVLSRFLTNEVLDFVEVDDPYIKARHQNSNATFKQEDQLNEIKESLAKRNVELHVKYDPYLHDREIRLSNGWIIKIGRGLDYFKPPETREKLCLGLHDLDLRPCLATTIDIFHKTSTKIK